MQASDYKCPSCSAPLKFNPESNSWKCEYCFRDYKLEDLEKNEEKFDDLDKFRKSVEFVSPQKYTATYDRSEQDRVLIQVLGKYQNYKNILSQIKKGTIRDLKLQRYLEKLYFNKNVIFEGEAEQEQLECFTYFDINRYLRTQEFKDIEARWLKEQAERNRVKNNDTSFGEDDEQK